MSDDVIVLLNRKLEAIREALERIAEILEARLK